MNKITTTTRCALAALGALYLTTAVAGAGDTLKAPPGPAVNTYRSETLSVMNARKTARLDASAPVRRWRPGDPIRYVPKRTYPARTPLAPANPRSTHSDPLLDLSRAVTAPYRLPSRIGVPSVNIDGALFSGAFPPDPNGDVGPSRYAQAINGPGGTTLFAVDKSGGFIFSATLSSIGAGACASGLGDPIVLYDALADRWLLSEFSAVANSLCVYISMTPDVGGSYHAYEFTAPGFPDYPKYGLHPDAYIVTTNESGGRPIYLLDRAAMLVGAATTPQRLTVPALAGFGFQALTPADLDGPVPPPGSPAYVARHRDDEVHNPGSNDPSRDFIELYEVDIDFAGTSTVSGPVNIPIAEIDSDLCGLFTFSCFAQPAGIPLDPLREVLMWRLQYRNFGSHETLVGNLTTDVSGADQGGIRWFELRDGGGGWVLHQEGTHSLDTDNRWMGSVAMNGEGDIALGYSVASPVQFTDIRYAGRRRADAPGTLPDAEFLIGAGSNSQNVDRWGDYSSMNVDPSDDCTFWYTNEYVTAFNRWDTRIAAFVYPECGVPPACGDGIVGPGEDCDDGGTADGDGCSALCTVEPGFTCTGEPSVCTGSGGDTCFAERFEAGIPGGWTQISTGPLPWAWGVTNDGVCFSNNLSGPGIPPAPNVTGGAGEAACIDSDATSTTTDLASFLCTPQFFAGNGTIAFDFLYNYQIFSLGAEDFFDVRVGTAPPSAVNIGLYDVLFTTTTNAGGFAALPGAGVELNLSAYSGQDVYACFGYGANFDWYAQVDDVVVSASDGCIPTPDSDGDGVFDDVDNCTDRINPLQVDTNGDGIGNACDPDFASVAGLGLDDCAVNFSDLGILKAAFFSTSGMPQYLPDADLTGVAGDPDGAINFSDLGRMKEFFFGPPGPSATPCMPIMGVANGSFETGDFTGWTLTDLTLPHIPLHVGAAGEDPGFGFFFSDPTDGIFAALHGFDGNGPGVIRIAQDVPVTPGTQIVVFDYRGAWNLVDFCPTVPCADRSFVFQLEPPGGGSPLGVGFVLDTSGAPLTLDTGPMTMGFDLGAFIGATYHAVFQWDVPEDFTGPGFFQLDNVRMVPLREAERAGYPIMRLERLHK